VPDRHIPRSGTRSTASEYALPRRSRRRRPSRCDTAPRPTGIEDASGLEHAPRDPRAGPVPLAHPRSVLREWLPGHGGGTIAAVLFGATTAFAQLQDALNRAWGVKPDPKRGQIRNFLAKRVFSFGVVLAVAFLLLVSLVLTTALAAFGDLLTTRLGAPGALLSAVNGLVSFVIVAALFAAMFKLLPDARIAWTDVWFGALGTALLFVLGKGAIGYYLGRTDPGSAYGAAGSLAIVLIWVYYSSMIVLFGAELTRVWAERYGSGVRPGKGAVEFVEVEHEVQRG